MKTNPLLVFRKELDGSALLFNPDNGETFSLNHTAAILWEKLSEGVSPDEILALFRQNENFPPHGEKEVLDFIAQLQEKGFLSE